MTGKKCAAWLSTFLLCFLFWVLLTWSVAPRELILGAVVAAIVAAFSARFLIHSRAFWLCNPIRLAVALFYFIVIFGWELIKANIAMVGMVFSPGLKKYRPGIIRVPACEDIRSDYGLATVANCITLTPGTITLSVAEDEEGRNYYYIHWANVTETDRDKAGQIIKGTMEKWIGRIWK